MPDEQKVLNDKLKRAVNRRIVLILNDGSRYSARLNYYGEESTVSGRPFIIVDYGVTESYNLDEIKDVEILRKASDD